MTRRNMYLCAFALASMLTFTGCQTSPQPEPKRDVAADIKAIRALGDEITAAFNSNDAAAVAATFAEDAIWMGPNQAAVEGRQAIQALLESRFKENVAKIAHTSLETQVAGDWAYERGNATTTLTPKSGKPMEGSYKYLHIYRRQMDGSWKIHLGIHNSNEPPPSAAGKKK